MIDRCGRELTDPALPFLSFPFLLLPSHFFTHGFKAKWTLLRLTDCQSLPLTAHRPSMAVQSPPPGTMTSQAADIMRAYTQKETPSQPPLKKKKTASSSAKLTITTSPHILQPPPRLFLPLPLLNHPPHILRAIVPIQTNDASSTL